MSGNQNRQSATSGCLSLSKKKMLRAIRQTHITLKDVTMRTFRPSYKKISFIFFKNKVAVLFRSSRVVRIRRLIAGARR